MVYFIVTSDSGSGSNDQYKVARSMEKLSDLFNINSVLLLGDNIYEEGVTSLHDHQFKTKFEYPYQNINKLFYLCLGNHDYGNSLSLKKNAKFQIEYSKFSPKWNLNDQYYSVKKGPCEFFFIDTNFDFMNDTEIMKQLNFISGKIKQSNKKWKILCGHHPWRSVGGHGNATIRLELFFNELIKRKGVSIDLYMCGHDHCKNLILKNHPTKKNKKIPLVVIGTGGKKYHGGDNGRPHLHNMYKNDSELLFHSPNLGTCLIDATPKKLKLNFYDELLQEEFNYTVQK